MFRIVLSVSLLAIVFGLSACSDHSNSKKIRIATAANMQYAMQELVQSFEEDTGIGSEIILGSSGKLAAQIRQGAPYDIFVSADMKYPQDVMDGGYSGAPKIYAYGKLVMWTLEEHQVLSFSELLKASVEKIAISNPEIAPYGIAAKEALEYYKIYNQVESKLVYGESVSQTNQFVLSKTADIGFTSRSIVLSNPMQDKGKWIEVPAESYYPISQGMVRVHHPNPDEGYLYGAEKFEVFLFSEKAQQILEKHGYISVNNYEPSSRKN